MAAPPSRLKRKGLLLRAIRKRCHKRPLVRTPLPAGRDDPRDDAVHPLRYRDIALPALLLHPHRSDADNARAARAADPRNAGCVVALDRKRATGEGKGRRQSRK